MALSAADSVEDRPAATRADDLARAFAADLAPLQSVIAASTSPEDCIRRVEAWISRHNPANAADVIEKALYVYSMAGARSASPIQGRKVSLSGTSEGAKKGWETRRRNGWTPEQFADAERKVSSLIADLSLTGPNGKGKGWKNREESFGALDAGTIADIKKANPAMNVETSEAIVDTAQLHHAMDHHGPGKEKRPNQIPLTHEDLKKLPDVLSDYDDIDTGKGKAEGKQTEAVVFRKKYPDGTIACVELDQYSEKRKGRVLKFQTM